MLHIEIMEMDKKFVRIYLQGITVLILNKKLDKEERIRIIKENQNENRRYIR